MYVQYSTYNIRCTACKLGKLLQKLFLYLLQKKANLSWAPCKQFGQTSSFKTKRQLWANSACAMNTKYLRETLLFTIKALSWCHCSCCPWPSTTCCTSCCPWPCSRCPSWASTIAITCCSLPFPTWSRWPRSRSPAQASRLWRSPSKDTSRSAGRTGTTGGWRHKRHCRYFHLRFCT